MNVTYFQDTDTLYIQFRSSDVAETRELDKHTLLDLDAHGGLCGLTLEHAKARTDVTQVMFDQIPA